MTEKTVAMVTGSGRGIGYAIARQLGRDGYAVVLMDIGEKERYTEALAALETEGIEYTYVKGDISTAEGRAVTVNGAMQAYGRIDVLVNNAGVAPLVRADLLEMTEESFDRVVGINMIGTIIIMMIAILALMLEEGYLVDIAIIYAMLSFLAVVVLVKIYIGIYRSQKIEEENRHD